MDHTRYEVVFSNFSGFLAAGPETFWDNTFWVPHQMMLRPAQTQIIVVTVIDTFLVIFISLFYR